VTPSSRSAPRSICGVVQISKVRMNPYVHLLQEALSDCGVACSVATGLSPRLVRTWRASIDVLHLHWLELLYGSPHLRRSLRRLAAVLLGLWWAKLGGQKIVYTVHNLNPHEPLFPVLDSIANRTLYALADAVHVHDKETALGVKRNCGFGRKVYVIPHGSYIGAYPNDCTRQEARQRLGLPGHAFVYLFLGQIRRYKGVEELLRAFSLVADGTSHLLLAGNVHDPEHVAELVHLTKGKGEIHTYFHYVPAAEVQYYMNACDVCVLPYLEVTTSGAAVLAFSFGRPIIASALGGLSELAADGRGILYSPQDSEGLLKALQEARLKDMAEAGRRALAWAREHEWRALAPEFARMYTEVLQAGS
jgi:beta-1,4-mannosyltransferase